MSFITSIGTAVPDYCFSQSAIGEFMVRAMRPNEEGSRKLRAIFRASGIETRYSVLDDYGKNKDYTFYANTHDLEPFPSTEKRIQKYREHGLTLSLQAIDKCLKSRKDFSTSSITHLITVSCTGMYAPGLDIDIVKSLGLSLNTQRTCINFMGCYAAFNAIKIADAICKASPKSKVLIVCTEMCSLLFSDGSAALLLESTPSKGWNLSPVAFHNALAFSDDTHMAWSIGNLGFEMKLSAYVPDIIQKGIKSLTVEMLQKIEKKISDIKYFAIHPGGKKILEVIESELEISKEQNQPAYRVLNDFGNMSSPTVLFVLDHILKNVTPVDDQSDVLSFAFGPGLTLEGILFTLHHS
jgi:predicted naringenin-chalcone synthase